MHASEPGLRPRVALRGSEPKQPPRLYKVLRASFAMEAHVAKQPRGTHVALRCSEAKQPSRLAEVFRTTFEEHGGEYHLRAGVALRCSEPKEPPRLCQVLCAASAVAVHLTKHALRLRVALLCSKPVMPSRLDKVFRPPVKAAVVHAAGEEVISTEEVITHARRDAVAPPRRERRVRDAKFERGASTELFRSDARSFSLATL